MLWRYMVGAVAARTGDEMSGPALLLLGLAVTASPAASAWLLAALTASSALGGPVLGVLLDRSPRPGRILACCLAGYAGALVALLFLLGATPVVVSLAVAGAAGLLGPALTGGWTAQLPTVTTAARLPGANAYDAMSYNVAGLTGPALAGLLATVASPAVALAAAALLIAGALPTALTLPAVAEKRREGENDAPAVTAGAAFRGIWGSPSLRGATVMSMVSIAGTAMLVVCAPLIGQRLAGGAGFGALLLAFVAGGALLANTVMARVTRLSPEAVLFWATSLIGAGMAVTASAGTFWVAAAGAALVGAGEGPQLTALFAVRHREASARVRSLVFTTGASLKITSFAAGSAVAGPLAVHSVPLALAAGAGAQVVAALGYRVARARWEATRARVAQRVSQ
ncbi:MFS transporter [Nonomuraea sp. NBC_01738]|uniref:MFS transporter n=1 Tax=Nonomuraea sp. NBC_01738 TaxID=2976003 RepID=UPI002E157AF8|nr:MFS transporter [Nonomuraea sp. NBC_01738]